MPHRRLLVLIAAFTLPLLAAGIAYAQGASPGAQSAPFAPAAQPAADTDGDGLPDAWEVQYGLKPDNANGVNGANGDPDRDGLVNGDEYANGTDPRKADTDGDGLPDLWEVENLTNPLAAGGDDGALGDPDGDGLLNKDELAPRRRPPQLGQRRRRPARRLGGGRGHQAQGQSRRATAPMASRPAARKPTMAKFERLNDDFAPPKPHKARP